MVCQNKYYKALRSTDRTLDMLATVEENINVTG